MGQQIHVANNTKYPVYTLALPNQDIADFDQVASNLISMTPIMGDIHGYANIAANVFDALEAAKHNQFNKAKSLMIGAYIQIMTMSVGSIVSNISRPLLRATLEFILNSQSLVRDLIDIYSRQPRSRCQEIYQGLIENTTITIPTNKYKKVNDTGYSGYLNIMRIITSINQDANMQLIFLNSHCPIITTEFCVHDDTSWIVNNNNIVRSKYGTIWEEYPKAGDFKWSSDPGHLSKDSNILEKVPAFQGKQFSLHESLVNRYTSYTNS